MSFDLSQKKIFEIDNFDEENYDIVSFYLANNIQAQLMKMDECMDKALVFTEETIRNVPLLLKQEKINSDSLLRLIYEIGPNDTNTYQFKHNEAEFAFNVKTLGNKPIGLQYAKMYYKLTIYYDDMKNLNEFAFDAKKYFNLYYLKIDNDEKIKLYHNDGPYWELTGPRKKRRLENIYLPKTKKEAIIKRIKEFNSDETIARYERFGIFHKYVCLFYGIPGSGKTSFVTAIASELNLNIASLAFDPKITDAKFRKLLSNLPKETVLLIEDMDCLFKDRKKSDEMKNSITLSGILNCLDGLSSKESMIVFITTNYKENLYDEALIRPGRVDDTFKFEHIKRPELKHMYRIFMENNFDEEKMKKFVDTYYGLNVKCSTALIQKYLFQYVDNPDAAIEHIDNIKDFKRETTFKEKPEMYT